MKPRDVSVSLYDAGNGTLRVWCASFNIKGSIPKDPQGRSYESAIRKKQKEIQKLLETLEIPDDQ